MNGEGIVLVNLERYDTVRIHEEGSDRRFSVVCTWDGDNVRQHLMHVDGMDQAIESVAKLRELLRDGNERRPFDSATTSTGPDAQFELDDVTENEEFLETV